MRNKLQYRTLLWLGLALFAGLALALLPVQYARAYRMDGVQASALAGAAGETPTDGTCYTEYTGDNTTDFTSTDASAVQSAVDAAASGGLIKIAGYCNGVQLRGGDLQTVYISQSLALQGGYTQTNWLASPDPLANPTYLDAEQSGRVVVIPAGFDVQLAYLNIINGRITVFQGGAGILHQGNSLEVLTSVISNNISTNGYAGGIQASGAITIADTTFFSNTADYGGGLTSFSTVSVSGSSFISNTALYGGGILAEGGVVTVQNSSISNNMTIYDGAGIQVESDTTLFLQDSSLQSNISGRSGGGVYNGGLLYVTNTTFQYNEAQEGGGLFNSYPPDGGAPGVATVSESTFDQNQAVFGTEAFFFPGFGGGVFNGGEITVTHSTLSSNTAENAGGGFANGDIDDPNYPTAAAFMMYTTLQGNSSIGNGGGVFNAGDAQLFNSTLSGNSADMDGGGIHNTFYYVTGTMTIDYATVVSNTADANGDNEGNGGGLYVSMGAVTISDSVLSTNSDLTPAGADDCGFMSGTAVSGGYNLLGLNTGCTFAIATDLQNNSPMLEPLAYNGGSTDTHYPLFGSPVLDYIPSGTNQCNITVVDDQRDSFRPINNLCDIGAVEASVFPPVAVDDVYTTTEDIVLNIAAPGVLTNDSGALTAVVSDTVSSGTLVFNADGSFTYTPNANFCGVDTFTYYAQNGQIASNLATVTINVICFNDAPLAVDDGYTTAQNTNLSIAAPGVLTNDSDLENDPLSALLDTDVAVGTLTLNSDGSFLYAPALDFSGVVTFTYHANDGQADSNIATVTITVTPAGNQPPVALEDVYTTTAGVTLDVIVPGVLSNDSDPNLDTLTTVLSDTVSNGTLVLNADGSFSYTPAAGFCGTDLFTYYANDGQTLSNLTLVTILVQCVNNPPVAVDDSYLTSVNTNLAIAAPGVLVNDTDADADPLAAVLDADVAVGSLVLNADGSFTYAPAVDFAGVVTFTYHVNDGQADSNIATVTITVTPAAVTDLAITKSATPDPVLRGAALVYSLLAANQGPLDANGVVVVDTLPADVSFVSASAGCSEANGVVTCNLGSLANGASAALQITVTVHTDAAATITNLVEISQAGLEANPADNQFSLDTTTVSEVVVYQCNGAVCDPAPWCSPVSAATTPSGRDFLGEFGNQDVCLLLNNLTAGHSRVTISFELFLIRSWDGNEMESPGGLPEENTPDYVVGPDHWQLQADGATLLDTTFANWINFTQAYPGPFPTGSNPAYTGSTEVNTLGYFYGPWAKDSVYQLTYVFNHTADSVRFDFIASGLQELADESWGLANIEVVLDASTYVPVPTNYLYLPILTR